MGSVRPPGASPTPPSAPSPVPESRHTQRPTAGSPTLQSAFSHISRSPDLVAGGGRPRDIHGAGAPSLPGGDRRCAKPGQTGSRQPLTSWWVRADSSGSVFPRDREGASHRKNHYICYARTLRERLMTSARFINLYLSRSASASRIAFRIRHPLRGPGAPASARASGAFDPPRCPGAPARFGANRDHSGVHAIRIKSDVKHNTSRRAPLSFNPRLCARSAHCTSARQAEADILLTPGRKCSEVVSTTFLARPCPRCPCS